MHSDCYLSCLIRLSTIISMAISFIDTTISTTIPKRLQIMKPSVQSTTKINVPSIDIEANVIFIV